MECLICTVKNRFRAKHTLEMISWLFQPCPIFSVWCFHKFSLYSREEVRGYCTKLEKCSSFRSFARILSSSCNKEHGKHPGLQNARIPLNQIDHKKTSSEQRAQGCVYLTLAPELTWMRALPLELGVLLSQLLHSCSNPLI